jgi:predicted nucleotidyltransferase
MSLHVFATFVVSMGRNMNNVIDVLMDYSKAVSSKVGKFTGVLYGSMARGDNNLWSDIDFLVISDNLPKNPLKRLEFLYSLADTAIEVKGYTRNEFLKMIEKRNPLALDALVEGKVIFERTRESISFV